MYNLELVSGTQYAIQNNDSLSMATQVRIVPQELNCIPELVIRPP